MRANLAIAIAAFGLLLSAAPSHGATGLVNRVSDILYGGEFRSLEKLEMRDRIVTQSAVVSNGACAPATVTRVKNVLKTSRLRDQSPMQSSFEATDELVLREIPAVLAATGTGAAIITEIPSDVDIRREDLGKQINDALAVGAISAAQASDLKCALQLVGEAEIKYRADGKFNARESRRLYNAMDRIGSDLDYYTNPGSTNLLGVRIVPGPWTFPWL